MLKNKIGIHLLSTMFFVAALLVVAVTPGNAWEVKIIDYETHNRNTNLTEGSYIDKGAWNARAWPTCSNGEYRFLTVELDPQRRGIAFWSVQIPKTGWYKLETSYRASENRTNDADYAVYVNRTTAEAENKVKPVYARSINQTQSSTPWVDLGTYCLKKNDISMIVLDGRDDSQSDSADASRWTFVGESYKSKRCGGVDITPIINPLLLKKNNR
jgi:hypothetical protein